MTRRSSTRSPRSLIRTTTISDCGGLITRTREPTQSGWQAVIACMSKFFRRSRFCAVKDAAVPGGNATDQTDAFFALVRALQRGIF